MLQSDKLSKVKTILGITGTTEDTLLNMYLDLAGSSIMQRLYPFEDKSIKLVPSKYEYLQCNIAVYLYNKRGAEGEKIHNENGINRTYESSDVPESMLKQVTPIAGGMKF